MSGDSRYRCEELERLFDRLALKVHLERLAVVTGAMTDLAWHVDIRKKVHLDLDGAVTGACLAATTLDVEREPAWLVAADLRLRTVREELSHVVEHSGVRGGVRSRGTPNGALVDVDDLVDVSK